MLHSQKRINKKVNKKMYKSWFYKFKDNNSKINNLLFKRIISNYVYQSSTA